MKVMTTLDEIQDSIPEGAYLRICNELYALKQSNDSSLQKNLRGVIGCNMRMFGTLLRSSETRSVRERALITIQYARARATNDYIYNYNKDTEIARNFYNIAILMEIFFHDICNRNKKITMKEIKKIAALTCICGGCIQNMIAWVPSVRDYENANFPLESCEL